MNPFTFPLCIRSKANIKKITGSIIADASVFSDDLIPYSYMWVDMGNYYGAFASGKYVKKAMKIIEDFKPEVLLGIGGGKVIDAAKLTASYKTLPFISIPTAASHDGISSPRASIKDLEKPTSVGTQAPLAIIADINIISKSPYRLTASGCGDILAKYTAVKDWKLAHKLKGEYYGQYAANLALMSAKLVMKNARAIQRKSV